MTEEEILNGLKNAILSYDEKAVKRLAREVIGKNIDLVKAMEVLSKAIMEVGDLFDKEKIYLPELMIAGAVTLAGIKVLKPKIVETRPELVEPLGKVVIGTVYGDIHDIGKMLVCLMLQSSGFEVYDLGKDVPAETFVERAVEVNADIVAMSAMTYMTRREMRTVLKALEKSGIRDKVKVLVGGAIIDEAFGEEIGADAYGKDMMDAVVKVKKLLGIKP